MVSGYLERGINYLLYDENGTTTKTRTLRTKLFVETLLLMLFLISAVSWV